MKSEEVKKGEENENNETTTVAKKKKGCNKNIGFMDMLVNRIECE